MQSSGVFPGLSQSLTPNRRPMLPQSRSGQTINKLARTTQQTAIAPPRKRRQITAQPPKTSNAFAGLQGLVGKALNGQQAY